MIKQSTHLAESLLGLNYERNIEKILRNKYDEFVSILDIQDVVFLNSSAPKLEKIMSMYIHIIKSTELIDKYCLKLFYEKDNTARVVIVDAENELVFAECSFNKDEWKIADDEDLKGYIC